MHDKLSRIKHGTIYTANPLSLSPWARNVNPYNPYDQAYGQFIRVEVTEGSHAGESWMIDTWDIDGHYNNTFECTRDMVEVNAHGWGHYRGRAYYNACVQLLPENVDLFEELCDLHDYEPLDWRENNDPSHYDHDDLVTSVWLAHEHKWPNGMTLVRKDAEVALACKTKALFTKVRHEYSNNPTGFGVIMALRVFYKHALENRDADCVQDVLPAVNEIACKSEMLREIAHDTNVAHEGQEQIDL